MDKDKIILDLTNRVKELEERNEKLFNKVNKLYMDIIKIEERLEYEKD